MPDLHRKKHMLDILWWWTLQRHSSGCHLTPGCHVYQLSPKFMKPLSFEGTGGTKIWTPTLGWWPKRICPGPAGIRAWTHGTFGSLAMRSWNGWNAGMAGFFTERHGKCRDRTGLRQYAACLNELLFHFLQMETKVMEHARTIWGLKQLVLELSVFWLHIRSLTVLKMHDGNLRTVRGGLCSFEPLFVGSQITEHQGMVSDRSTLSWTDMNTFVYGQFFLHTTVLARPQFKLVTFVHE